MEQEDQLGFSYKSPKKQKRSVVRILILEVLVLIVVCFGILGTLFYLGIIPFPSIFQNFNLFQTQSEYNIDVVSEIPGYAVEVKNESQLIELLKNWQVFGSNMSTRYGAYGSTNGKPIKKIIIHLTDEQQRTFAFSNNGNIYSSAETRISPEQLDVNVQLAQSILKDNSQKNKLGQRFKAHFLMAIYKTVNEARSKERSEEVNLEIQKILQTDPKAKLDYFYVRKK